MASVAYRMAKNGKTVSDAELKVNYLRPSQAERERLEAEKAAKN